jgi:hypothetical protein
MPTCGSVGKLRPLRHGSYRPNSLPKADLMAATLAVREPLPRYCLQRAAVEAVEELWALGMACRSIQIECTLYCVVQHLVQYEQGQLSFCGASAATTFGKQDVSSGHRARLRAGSVLAVSGVEPDNRC